MTIGMERACQPPASSSALGVVERRVAELTALVWVARDVQAAPGVEETCQVLVRAAAVATPRAASVRVGLRRPDSGALAVIASSRAVSSLMASEQSGLAGRLQGGDPWWEAQRSLLPVWTDPVSPARGGVADGASSDGCSRVCVPLVVDGSAIGALQVTGRAGVRFDDADIDRLVDLAAVGAPAVHSALELRDARHTLQSQARARTREQQEIVTYDALFARVLDGAGLVEIVDAVVGACDAISAVLGVDNADREVITAPLGAELDPARDRWILDGFEELRATGSPVQVRRGEQVGVFVSARFAGRSVGAVLVLAQGPIDDGDLRTVCRFVGLYALIRGREIDARTPDGEGARALRALLSRSGAASVNERIRAARTGVDLAAPWTVGLLGLPPRADRARVHTVLRSEGIARHVMVVDGAVVFIAPDDQACAAAGRVAGAIRADMGLEALVCAIAVTDAASGGLARGYRRVSEAMRLLRSLGRKGGTVDVARLPAHLTLWKPETTREIETYLAQTIGPLIAFDRDTSSELVHTVRVFFEENMNSAATARRLELHPNTVVKRQQRVTELLGPDWACGAGALSLRIALDLHALASDPEVPAT